MASTGQGSRTRIDLDDGRTAWRLTLGLAAALTLARIIVLFASPLELYPDEAQYWLWSRQLHWGYVSKPPMVAWLIAATTAVGGSAEAWVRLAAPLVHAGAMLALYPVGRRLYGPATGLLAAALYGLMPAVQISSLFVATDAPMMLFLALALWAYVELCWRPDAHGRRWLAAGFGLALGLALMAKQAALYLPAGVVLHAALDRDARRAWLGGAWAAALALLVAALIPNLVWQAGHGFATVAHTAKVNARWNGSSLAHPGELGGFLAAQFGVFGPIPFAVLLGGTAVLARRKALVPADRLLLCLALPPLVIVSIQAFVSHANAHWAAAAYLPGSALVAAWLVRWRAKAWTAATLVLQALAAVVLLAAVGAPQIADATGNGRRLARVRGWNETARFVTGQAQHLPIAAVAVEDRYMFNELAYYGRGFFGSPGAPPLRMRPAAQALNEAELSSPLTREESFGRILIAESVGTPPTPALPGDFETLSRTYSRVIPLGGGKTREIVLQLGEGYALKAGASGRSSTPP
jgi:4-amino-4-deoxy-L-arabinose transferase-like glycosyltransferase